MTKIATSKGDVIIMNLKRGYSIRTPKGTIHDCVGRNLFYSADILRRQLELFYGADVARKAMDSHFNNGLS